MREQIDRTMKKRQGTVADADGAAGEKKLASYEKPEVSDLGTTRSLTRTDVSVIIE